MRTAILIVVLLALSACGGRRPMQLRRVTLYQNGVGYFERTGHARPEGVQLRLARHEVDDVLTTLTVLDPSRPDDAPSPSAVVPRGLAEEGETQSLEVDLGGSERDVTLAYSAPTSAWRASYRIVLPDERGDDAAFLQAWAVVDNTSAEDWRGVDLTLATDAPLSFAVDLRTPRRVPRPNVTGYSSPAVALGAVRSSYTTRVGQPNDRDGDGVLEEDDRCPDEPEDLDSFEDVDGCPDADNDADGIMDVVDACPNDPEGYNGTDDDDGCPDVGAVTITNSAMVILDSVFFASDRAEIEPRSAPILDAIAATLQGNPRLSRVDVQGHADRTELDPWRLSAERAAMVQAALVERGVDATRLAVRALGDSRPIAEAGDDPRNRSVTFQIEDTTPAAEPPTRGVSREAMRRSGREDRLPEVGGSGTRFPVARAVSIPAGSSAMVTILHRPALGEDVLLFRTDPNVPASVVHPFRAARLENQSGVDLVAGPVTLFARGELVGEGLLDGLRAGQNAFIPYAVDTSTRVASRVEERSEPARVVSFARGQLRLEDTRVRRTVYEVEAGARIPARIFVRHRTSAGYTPHDLPPHTERRGGSVLVPVHLEPSRDARIGIEERRAEPRVVDLLRDLRTDVRPYLADDPLAGPLRARLEALLDARDALLRVEEEARLLTQQLAETARRRGELRRSIEALDERGGRSSAPARRRMAGRLEEAVRHGERLAERLASLRAQEVEARLALRDAASESAPEP